MSILTLEVSEQDLDKIKEYAVKQGMTVSEYVRNTALQHIEDEENERNYEESIAQYLLNPALFTIEDSVS